MARPISTSFLAAEVGSKVDTIPGELPGIEGLDTFLAKGVNGRRMDDQRTDRQVGGSMIKYLRIAVSVLSMTACALLLEI